jgi:hypothetical protein
MITAWPLVRIPSRAITLAIISDCACAEGIDNFDPLKISLIIGHNNAAVGLSDGSHDHV